MTMMLAAMGGPGVRNSNRLYHWGSRRRLDLMCLEPDKLAVDQWTKHKAFCTWCMLASATTFGTAPFAVAEAIESLHILEQR